MFILQEKEQVGSFSCLCKKVMQPLVQQSKGQFVLCLRYYHARLCVLPAGKDDSFPQYGIW